VAASAAWTRALNAAAFDANRNRFIEIGRAAGSYQNEGAVIDSWVAAVRSGWGQLPLYRDLSSVFGALASRSRSEDLLAMCRTLLRFEPYNPDLCNNFNYLALIHGLMPPSEVARATDRLAAQHPDKPEYHSAQMLAELMDGRPAEALDRLPELRGSRRVAPMMITALEGAARVMAGESETGSALLKQVNWMAFMRQERAAFRQMLIKLNVSGLPPPEPETPETGGNPADLPAWRKAVERFEKERAGDILPTLPVPRIPGADTRAVLPGLPEPSK
jgi:hypothetical protein